MGRAIDEFREQGAEVVAIGPGGTTAARLAKAAMRLSIPVLSDPDRTVYRGFGLVRKLMIQQSGSFVVDRHGFVRYAQASTNPHDALAFTDLRRAVFDLSQPT